MKLMTNFISASILASSLTAFNVPHVFASEIKAASMVQEYKAQDAIKSTFANFSLAINMSPVENKQVILRQALTDAAKKLVAAGVTQADLINYATSDMNSAEAKAFKAQVSSLSDAGLDSVEGQAQLERVLSAQSRGSNFLPCGVGFFTAMFAGTGALVLAIVALSSTGDYTRIDRQNIEKDKAAINSEITILQGEGVANNSYLITSRRAELVQLDIQLQQMLDDKAQNAKDAQTLGMIAGGLAVVAVVGAISEGSCQY